MPNGIYRVTLITDDLGDWSKIPRPFGNRVRVNNKTVRVLTKDPSDWILDSGKKGSSPLGGEGLDFSETGLQFPRIDRDVMAGNAKNYGDPIGRVDTVKGFATVVRVDGQTETLSLGDPIYKGDKLTTGAGSSMGLLLGDETTVAMSDKAEMVLDDLVYNPDEESGNLSISILDGLFTMKTGKIASTDPQAMIVRTPRAMSAIRGTNPGFDVDADGGTENFFNLPDADTGDFGSFSVSSTETGEQLLMSGDFDVLLLDEDGDLRPIDLDPEVISQFFAAVREAMPPQPSSGDGSEDDFGGESGEASEGVGGSVTIEIEIVNGILEIEFLGADQIFLAAIVLDPIEELEEELDPEELLATALAEALSEVVTEAGDEPEDDPSPT
ncbi:MAG: FecR domain-containing protein [Proteobacteria bacterium]|nr:FecR domain-containing protein [Pseudomonadota bacterium]MDA1356270.1 FecR domain-containing protein [Pseudomonadota bacterium]